MSDADRDGKIAERIVFAMNIYSGYTMSARGPSGCMMEVLDIVAPDVAVTIREHGAHEAYQRHFDVETGTRRETPRTFVRSDPNPDSGIAYETCSECGKHVRHHYGSPSEATVQWPAYRCDPRPEPSVVDV